MHRVYQKYKKCNLCIATTNAILMHVLFLPVA